MRVFANFLKLTVFLTVFFCGAAHAERRNIFYSTGQSGWKLENYFGDNVALWETASTCSGAIGFPPDATKSDKNRFYATLMAVKVSNATMFIYYMDETTSCNMVSFGIL